MISRKKILQNTALALGTMSLAKSILADEHDQKSIPKNSNKAKYAKALMAAIHCKLAAEICINHCITELAKGEKMMAGCMRTVSETKAACESFISLASLESEFTKKMANLCIEICKKCEAECKKHASHSQVCKDCMESCKSCIKEMQAI